MRTSLRTRTMRTGASAAVGVVAELMDMHSTLCVGIVARDVVGNGSGRILVRLLEGDGALDFRVSTEDSNYS